MRITLLHGNQQNYSCNAYLVRGDSNEPEDVNTLVDVGIDGSICGEIENLCTGIGKKKVAQVVLTHGHYDHAAGLGVVVALITRRYVPLRRASMSMSYCLTAKFSAWAIGSLRSCILRDIRRIRFVCTVPGNEPSSRETRRSM